MKYFKFIGDADVYGLVHALRFPGGAIVYVDGAKSWTAGASWKELSKVELLIELHKGTPVFHYQSGVWTPYDMEETP